MNSPLSRAQRRAANELLDRIEDRLLDAPQGLHEVGEPASEDEVVASGLPLERGLLWTRWNGLSLGHGDVTLFSLHEIPAATQELIHRSWLQPGDCVIGRQQREWLVCPHDPWQEGGDVVLVGEDGQRAPLASRVERLVLSTLAEHGVLFDEEGEYRSDLFDATQDELEAHTRRKVLRRRLDMDADAVLPRFQLAMILRASGEARAAQVELRHCLKIFPDFAWAHFELGQALVDQGESAAAVQAFERAAEVGARPDLKALFLAHAARHASDDARKRFAAEVKSHDPAFVSEREAEIREALAEEDGRSAQAALHLGLAVEPRHLGLLTLQNAVAQALAAQVADEARAQRELAEHAANEDDEDEDLLVAGQELLEQADDLDDEPLDLDADDRELGPMNDENPPRKPIHPPAKKQVPARPTKKNR